MKQLVYRIALCVGVLGFVAQGVSGPPEYVVTRSTIDGGGVMRSTADELELSGSIGQPDAGTMSGGEFELAGGYWFGVPPTDCNQDGLVNLLDHETFHVCLLGPGGGIGAGPCPCFDVDRDGEITVGDYSRLQAGFTGQ